MSEIVIKPTGDSALTVEFENRISISVNRKVHALAANIGKKPIKGVIEMVPGYRTLMIYYQPEIISYGELCAIVKERSEECKVEVTGEEMVVELPVCYGGEYGPDIAAVAKHDRITEEEVIRRHTEQLCFVYALGFAPGLAYIGSPNPTFTIPRLTSPRIKIDKGSIVVWESQTTVIPFDQPCGWHIIGRTPALLYDDRRECPSYFQPGQWVKFVPIDEETYKQIHQSAMDGSLKAVTYRKEN